MLVYTSSVVLVSIPDLAFIQHIFTSSMSRPCNTKSDLHWIGWVWDQDYCGMFYKLIVSPHVQAEGKFKGVPICGVGVQYYTVILHQYLMYERSRGKY